MRALGAKCSPAYQGASTAMDAEPTNPPAPRKPEQERLAQTHHELRTALTSLRSNVELVRIELRDPARAEPAAREQRVAVYLVEMETALDRLVRLAEALRAWHALGKRTESEPA